MSGFSGWIIVILVFIYLFLVIAGVIIGVAGVLFFLSMISTSAESDRTDKTDNTSEEKEKTTPGVIDSSPNTTLGYGKGTLLQEDKKFIHEETGKLTAQLDKIMRGNSQSSDSTTKILNLLVTISDMLDSMKASKSIEQNYVLNHDDKGFIEQRFSDFAQEIEKGVEQQTESVVSFNKKVDEIHKTLCDIINAQGYKACISCGNSTVPKNASRCPYCTSIENNFAPIVHLLE